MTNAPKLTEGKIQKQLFELSKPTFWGTLSIILFQLADSYFLALYDTSELAAATFAYPLFSLVIAFFVGLSTATSIVLSPLAGNKEWVKFRNYSTHIFLFSIFSGAFLLIFLIANIDFILHLFNVPEEIFSSSRSYLFITYIGLFFLLVNLVFNGQVRALGHTKIIARCMYISAIINFVFDPLLIFGWGFFPEMGVRGAAISSVIGWSVGCVIIALHIKNQNILSFSRKNFQYFKSNVKEWLQHSISTSLSQLISPLTSLIIIFFITSFGIDVIAGYGLAHRIEKLALLIASAFGISLMIFCGQNLGANNINRIKEATKIGQANILKINLIIAFIGLLLIPVYPHVVSLSTKATDVFVMFVALVFITLAFQGISQITLGILNGLGFSKLVLHLNIVRVFLIMLPLLFIAKIAGEAYIWIFIGLAISHILFFCLASIALSIKLKTIQAIE